VFKADFTRSRLSGDFEDLKKMSEVPEYNCNESQTMNLRAKCVNRHCKAYGIVKSVMIAKLAGYGAPNDRAICPICGQLMRTTKSIAVAGKRPPSRLMVRGLGTKRLLGRKKTAARKPARKRGPTKRG
jgi:hypothetical protein